MARKVVALCAFALGGTWAQDEDWKALARRLDGHPSLVAARQSGQEARSDALRAGIAPRPVLELEGEGLPGMGGFREADLGAWVGVELGTVRRREAEREWARAEASLVEADTLRVRRELLAQAWGLRETWLLERNKAELLDSLGTASRAWVDWLETARGAGAVPAWEIVQARTDRAARGSEAETSRRRATAAWSELASLVAGAPDALPEPGVAAPYRPLDGREAGSQPDSLRAAREREVARRRAEALAASDRPVASLALGVTGRPAQGDAGIGMRVSVPLPPWNRVGWETAKAMTNSVRLVREADLAMARREALRRRLRDAEAVAAEALRRHAEGTLPARRAAREALEEARRAGAVPPGIVWQAREREFEARLELLEKLAALRSAQWERLNHEGVEP